MQEFLTGTKPADGNEGEMEAIPKTVRDRLAAQQVTADHPDADLLNAYAENTLATREREGISAHLARCRACRDVMLLAMPEIDTMPAVTVTVPQRRWISRPVVRWLGATTAIVVVGAAVVVSKFDRSSQMAPLKTQQAQVATSPSTPAPPTLSAQLSEPPSSAPAAADRMYSAPQKKEARAQQPAVVGRDRDTLPVTAKPGVEEARSVAAQPGSPANTDRLDQYAKLQRPPSLTFDTFPAAGAIGGPIQRNNIVTSQSAPAPPPPLYNLQVQAQAGTVQSSQLPPNSQTLTGNGNNRINVSNTPAPQMTTASTAPAAAPVREAKGEAAMAVLMRPPIDAASAESSAAVISRAPGQAGASTSGAKAAGVVGGLREAGAYNAVPNAACALIVDGIRCVQNNHKMEFHHPGANLKVIMSQGNVVWAGGDALMRSSDGGATWSDVKKPVSETITRISIMPDSVYVGGVSGALWKTADNGMTWVQASPEQGTTQR
jgi:hypothetical protein